MLSNMSHLSDNENKSNIQTYLREKNIILERFKEELVPFNLKTESDVTNFRHEYYVKEEVMVSDISDISDHEASNNDKNILRNNEISLRNFQNNITQEPRENTKAQIKTENISGDQEINFVNISADYEEISDQTSKNTLANSSILYCPNCNASRTSVNNHSKSPCEICGKLMEYRCLKCDNLRTTFVTKVYYHMKRQCGKPEFHQCEHCEYRNRHEYLVRRHALAKHSVDLDENGLVECAKCSGKFRGKRNLRRHQRLCGLEPFLKCKFCDYSTKFRGKLKIHLEGAHANLKATEMKEILSEAAKMEHELIGMNTDNMFKSTDCKRDVATMSKFSSNDFIKIYCSKCNANFQKVPGRGRKCPQCGALAHLQCLKCERRYINWGSMYSHLRSKCGPKEFVECAYCGYQVVTKHRLRLHIELRHTTVAPEDYVKCRKCGKGFKHRLNQLEHEQRCVKELYLQCHFCPLRRKNGEAFERHVQQHILHPENGDATIHVGFVDRRAGSDVEVQADISKSEKSANSRGPKPMTEKEKSRVQKFIKAYCSKCRRETDAIQYIRKCSLCANKFSYFCGECKKAYPKQNELRRHIVHNHLKNELKKRQQCSRCGKKFLLYKDLYHHRLFCGKEPNFQCDYCPYKSKQKYNLTKHIQIRHSETAKDRKFCFCHKCGKRFKKVQSLVEHRRIYCGKEPRIECEHCKFKSYKKDDLIVHLQRVHRRLFTKELLKCQLCGKESSNAYFHAAHVKKCDPK